MRRQTHHPGQVRTFGLLPHQKVAASKFTDLVESNSVLIIQVGALNIFIELIIECDKHSAGWCRVEQPE